MHIPPLEVGDRHGEVQLALCGLDVFNLRCLGDHGSHLLINWIREARALYVKGRYAADWEWTI